MARSDPGQALQALIGGALIALALSILVGWAVARWADWIAGTAAGVLTAGIIIYLDSRRSRDVAAG